MLTRVYLKSVVVLLLHTAAGKFLMVFGEVPVLDKASPFVSLLSNRTLILIAGAAEVAVASFLLSGYGGSPAAFVAVGLLAVLFLCLRLVLWVTGYQGYCGCLRNLSDVLHLSPQEADRVPTGILLYFLAGSCAFTAVAAWSKGRPGIQKAAAGENGVPNYLRT